MKTLFIMRHAKSSWDGAGLSDHARPLNKRGERDAPAMGRLLKEKNLTPDLLISSDAVRAKATAELVAQHSGYRDPIVLQPALYGTDPEKIIRYLQNISSGYHRVLVVGHNPELEMLVAMLARHDEKFPTAALAHFELPIDDWPQLSIKTPAELVNLWRPKDLGE